MSLFTVWYTYSDDTALRDTVRPDHRAFLGELAAEGTIVLSGPVSSPEGAPADLALDGLDRFEPTIFIYDHYPGGMGFSSLLYDRHRELLARTRELIGACPCPAGCPSCVGPVNEVSPECKTTAGLILDTLLESDQP